MMKVIVTHVNPDLDAIASVWLFRKFDPEFNQAEVRLVPAGGTYKNLKVDVDDDIVHVDTGLGKFDHHQTNKKICATQLVFNYLKNNKKELKNDKALIRLIKVVRSIDHFEDCLWPQATDDIYNFELEEILRGVKAASKFDDFGMISFGSQCIEGVYTSLKIKIKAENDLKKGIEFKTRWGKAIGCLSHNDQVLKLGQKMGYVLVVQKDGQTEHIRIKARPDSKINLTRIKDKLAVLDTQATWFLHISKRMLLNGSTKNPKMRPSRISLKKVIEIIQN